MKRKALFSVLLALLLAALSLSPALAAGDRLEITNPYAGIDWETVGQYKTALHTHTNASDGDMTLRESLFRHVQTGFDAVAITDHGVVDRGWETAPAHNLIKTALTVFGRSEGELEYLGAAGVFPDGTAYTYANDRLSAGERTVLRLPYGVENNAVSVNAHVNSWFLNETDNSVTTYRDALRRINKRGGVCVINHPGEYTKARYEIRSADAYDEADPAYAYYINKFAALLEEYPACAGIDVNSKGDDRTRFDRILWDKLLTRFSANGETVFGFATSDAHQPDKIDTGFTVLLLPELTSPAAEKAIRAGEFFAASHCIGNYDEIREYRDAVSSLYGTGNETFLRLDKAEKALRSEIEGSENGERKADDKLDTVYTVLDGEGFTTVDAFPRITGMSVDDGENVISLSAENALFVRFVSGGRTLAVKRADDASLDLDEINALGDYVRLEVFGDGGILYTQAFLLNAAEKAGAASPASGIRELGFLDFLLAEFHRFFAVLRRFFSTVL